MARVLDRKALAADIQDLSKLNPVIPVAAIIGQWLIIAIAISAAIFSRNWAVYLLAIVVIGSRQHALAILVHDAAHYRMFKNRTANNLVADLFCAFPVGLSTSLYRRFHLDHHRYTNTPDDPEQREMKGDDDWSWPKMRREIMLLFLKDVTGANSAKIMKIIGTFSPARNFFRQKNHVPLLTPLERGSFLLFLVCAVSLVTAVGGWFYAAVLWFLPSATVLSWIFRMRAIGEHTGVEKTNELDGTRFTEATRLERWLISPFNINYHLDHHLFPSVPWYNLPRLHRRLLQEPEYREKAHITRGYLSFKTGVLSELNKETANPV